MKKLISVLAITVLASLIFSGAAFSKVQEICPVMGGKINKEIYADHDGKRVYFCCSGCIAPFKKDPETYLKKMKEEGVDPAEVPVTSETKTGHEGHDH